MKRQLGKLKRAAHGYAIDRREPLRVPEQTIQGFPFGHTVSGQEIAYYQFGTGPQKILLSFGIHGNEVGTVKLAHHVLRLLATTPTSNTSTVFVIPCLNPDGLAKAQQKRDYFSGGRLGRLNANGVDLNRNFPVDSFVSKAAWNHGKDYAEKTEVFAGTQGGSEPEVNSLLKLIKGQSIDLWLSFHNAGRDVVPSTDRQARALAQRISKVSGFKLLSETEWQELGQTGTPKEWCEEAGVSFVEVEGSNRWKSDWPELKPVLVELLK